MFDYLNEFLFFAGRTNRRANSYRQALAIKKRGDALLFNQLCNEWAGRFKWEYEPADEKQTIATELIELTILTAGMCAIFPYSQKQGSYEEASFRNGRPAQVGNLSFYGYPSTVEITSYNGDNVGRFMPVQDEDPTSIANCVLIYDNATRWSPIQTIMFYVDRLSVINTSINACIRNILGTEIINCTQEQAKTIIKQREAGAVGVPYLISYDEYQGKTNVDLLTSSGASDELKTLFEAFDKTHADFLQSIGVRANNEIDKKSGVTPIEIVENRQNVDLILNQCYESRLRAIRQAERIGITPGTLKCVLSNFDRLTVEYDADGHKINADNPDGIREAEPGETKEEGENDDVV